LMTVSGLFQSNNFWILSFKSRQNRRIGLRKRLQFVGRNDDTLKWRLEFDERFILKIEYSHTNIERIVSGWQISTVATSVTIRCHDYLGETAVNPDQYKEFLAWIKMITIEIIEKHENTRQIFRNHDQVGLFSHQ
jgi:hypothetical protein